MTVPSATIFSRRPRPFARRGARPTARANRTGRSAERADCAFAYSPKRRIERRFEPQFVADLQVVEDAANALKRLLIRHDREDPRAIGLLGCGGVRAVGAGCAPVASQGYPPAAAPRGWLVGAAIGPIFAAIGSWTLSVR